MEISENLVIELFEVITIISNVSILFSLFLLLHRKVSSLLETRETRDLVGVLVHVLELRHLDVFRILFGHFLLKHLPLLLQLLNAHVDVVQKNLSEFWLLNLYLFLKYRATD